MEDKISRSEQKRRYKQIEEMAKELASLSNNDLKGFPGSDEIKEGIISVRGLKAGARKRQIKYLAKLLRETPADGIYDFLSDLKGSRLKEKSHFHEAERLRDAMINEGLEDYKFCLQNGIDWEPGRRNDLIDQMVPRYQSLKVTDVQKLVYQYVRTRSKVHYRELFRLIIAAIEQEEISRKVGSGQNI